MIRTVWAVAVAVAATLGYGLVAIVAAIFRVEGNVYSWATRQWARAIIRASRTPVRVEGLEHVRREQPQIIASNHIAAYDILALASVLPVRFAFVAKKELERIPFFGTAWKAAGHISIDRENRQKAIASLRRAGRKIREENSTVIIFVEGTRSRTGELLPFKKGAFTLAAEAAVPVVPTVVSGSNRILRQGSRRVHPHPITVRFGTPIEPQPPGERSVDRLMEEAFTRMQRMLAAPVPDAEAEQPG